MRDDRLCVPLTEFQDQKINISQEPSKGLVGIELELYFDSDPPKELVEIFYSSDGFKASDSRITSHLTDVTSKNGSQYDFGYQIFAGIILNQTMLIYDLIDHYRYRNYTKIPD